MVPAVTQHAIPSQHTDLPLWLWLGFPPLMLVAHVITHSISYETWVQWMKSEYGLVENGTVVVLLVAVVLGVMTFLQRRKVKSRLFGPWVVLLTIGCFYFAGEEASWGYHLGLRPFGEEISQALQQHNDQGETNLHNLPGLWGGMLDNTPRFLLSMAALIGGIIVPLWNKYKRPITWPTPWIWPTMACLPVCALAWLIRIPKHILRWLDLHNEFGREWRTGEDMEYLLGVFLMLYMASLYYRARKGLLELHPQGNVHAA
jgi:hypothetical protein